MNENFLGRCESCGLLFPEEDLTAVAYNGIEEYWDEGCIAQAQETGQEVIRLDSTDAS